MKNLTHPPLFFLQSKHPEQALQNEIDRLASKKINWLGFSQRYKDLTALLNLQTTKSLRNLLHLAVLDNQIPEIQTLKNEASLKAQRDIFGLSPIDIAHFLGRKEALSILQPLTETPPHQNNFSPQLSGFEYLCYPIFESREDFEEVLQWIRKLKQADKIDPEKIWMGVYFDKEIGKAVHPPVSVRSVDSQIGFGVFADKKIAPCSYIGEYTGVIQRRSNRELKEKKYCLRYASWECKSKFVINAEHHGNFTRFINHSEKPNISLQSVYWRGVPRMIFIALKEIGEGKQLTFDYGKIFWENSSEVPKEFSDDF